MADLTKEKKADILRDFSVRLMNAHYNGTEEDFKKVVMEVIAFYASIGEEKAADELRELLELK